MKSSEESNRELAVRVKYLAAKWLKQQTTVDGVTEAISQEQLLNTLQANVWVWVRERKPNNICICLEAGQLADDYAQARKQAGGDLRSEDSRKGGWGKQSSAVQEKGRGSEELSKDEDGKSQPYSKGPRCFSCHQHGHVASRCPSKEAMYGGVKRIPFWTLILHSTQKLF